MFSTRQSVASDGTPFLSMPIFRNRPRLILPKSIMFARPTRPRCPGEYYQNQHIAEPMADVPLIRPSEIRNRRGKIHKFAQDCTLRFKFICYLCKKVKCRFIGHGQVVWIFHNYSFFLFKFTKNPPLDQIFIPLIWLILRILT